MKKAKILKILSLVIVIALLTCIVLTMTLTPSAATKVKEESFVKDGLGLVLGEDYDYSFAVVGDTQSLNYGDISNGTSYMNGLYQWIIDNSESKNIQYVMGLGDIVDTFQSSNDQNSSYYKEWAHAQAAISLLDRAGIPYSLVRGNHDITSGLNEFFGESTAYYNGLLKLEAEGKAGIFERGKIENTWRKIEVGSDKYLIITFDWFPSEEAMYWAENVINANPDYKVIVTTHHYMASDGTFSDNIDSVFPQDQIGNSKWEEAVSGGFVAPRTLWEEVLSKYENVEMILCGHVDVDDIQTTQLVGKNGNTVTCMLIDPQTIDGDFIKAGKAPVGMVAMFYFKENGEVVNVEYISTVRANDGNESTYEYLKDINQFSVSLEYQDGWTKTEYGYIPTEKYESSVFHMFVDDDGDPTNDNVYLGSYDRWVNDNKDDVGAYLAAKQYFDKGGIEARRQKSLYVLMKEGFVYDGHNDASYNGAEGIPGSLTLDLNGGTYIVGNSPVIYIYNSTKDRNPRINLINGNFELSGWNPLIGVQTKAGSMGGASDLNLSNLNVYFAADGTGTKDTPIITTYSGTSEADVSGLNMTVTDCHFNLKDNAPNKTVTAFSFNADNMNHNATLVINGGSISAASYAKFNLFAGNEGSDSISLGKGSDGEYTKLIIGDSATIATIYNTTTKDANGETVRAKFVANAEPNDDGAYTYTLIETTESDGKFDISSITKVFGNFDKNGNKKGSHDTWGGAINTTNAADGRVLVLTRDYIIEAKKDIKNLSGEITVDLNGHTLTIPSTVSGLMNGFFGDDSKNGASLKFIFKNGTILNEYAGSLIQFEYGANNGIKITRDFVFENVTFEGRNHMFAAWDKLSSTETTVGTRTNAVFNNCTFNYTEGVKIFPLDSSSKTGEYKCVFNVTINGGRFISDKPLAVSDIATFNTVSGYEDTLVFGKYNGEYPEFYINTSSAKGQSASSYTSVSGLSISALRLFDKKTINEIEYNVYQLADLTGYVKTDYGIIPPAFTDAEKYPFVIFKDGSFYKACTAWYDSNETGAVKDAVSQGKTAGSNVTILLRRDFAHDSSKMFNEMSSLAGTLTVDLGGFTMKHNREIMKFNQKGANAATVNFENGSLITTERRMLGFGTYSDTTREIVTINFTNVYIGFESIDGSTQYSSLFGIDASKTQYEGGHGTANITFENCVIDIRGVLLSGSTTEYVLFNCTGDVIPHTINVTVCGGEIIVSPNYSFKMGSTDTYPELKDADTVRFDNKYGSNTKITLPLGTAAPIFEYLTKEDKKAGTVKWNDNTTLGTTTYIIRESALVSFVPKSSITLDRELVYNVYVPVCEELNSFILDGKLYSDFTELSEKIVTLDDGKKYYHFEIELPSATAARDIVLKASVTVANKSYTGTWTMNIPKYAKSVISGDNATETQLVKDVLAYIKAAYVYFGTNDAAAIGSIEEIIGKDYSAKPTVEGSATAKPTGFKTVTFVLDGTPAMRFYLAEGADASEYEFYISGKLVNTEVAENGKYIDIDVYAYALCESVECKIGGENAGSFHINAYYAYVSGDEYTAKDKAELVSLTESFWRYLQSARAYRNSVISG